MQNQHHNTHMHALLTDTPFGMPPLSAAMLRWWFTNRAPSFMHMFTANRTGASRCKYTLQQRGNDPDINKQRQGRIVETLDAAQKRGVLF